MARGVKGSQGVCSADGCDNTARSKGMCPLHYNRSRKERTAELKRIHRELNPEVVRGWNQKTYYKHREKRIADSRAYYIKHNYGLTVEEYKAILAGGCAVCRANTGRMHLDHDHATGQIRDALCSNCNTALGLLGEDSCRVRALAEYIESHAP